MKRIFLTAATTVFVALSSAAQGTLNFANSSTAAVVFAPNWPDPGYPVTAVEGFYVQLFWAPFGTTDHWLFQPVGAQVQVGVPAPGRFAGGVRTIEGIAPGAVISCFVETFRFNGVFIDRYGFQARTIFTVDTADPALAQPAPLITAGLDPYTGTIIVLPEPSCLAIAGLGATWLLFFRRRQ